MKINHQGTNKITMPGKLRVEVELEAFKKMQCYIDICNEEVGWLGTAYKEGNVITIKDVFLFDQEVHATTCELTPQGLADFTMGLFETLPSDDAMEIVNNMALWGHSHVRMSVSPSGQDDAQLREFSNSGYTWFLRVIGNKRGEFEYTYMDYETGIEVKDLDWEVKIPGLDLAELKKEVKAEVELKVKRKEYTSLYSPTYGGGYSNNLGTGRTATSYAEQLCMARQGYIRDDNWPDSLLKDPFGVDDGNDNAYEYVEEGLGDYHSELISTFPIEELDNETYDTLNNAMCAGMSIEDFANIAEIGRHFKVDKDKFAVISYYLEKTNSDVTMRLALSELNEVIEICKNCAIYLKDYASIEVKEAKDKKSIYFTLNGEAIQVELRDESDDTTTKHKAKIEKDTHVSKNSTVTGKKRGRPRKSESEKAKNKKTINI